MRVLVVAVVLQVCWSLPVEKNSVPPAKRALDFMKQYGYLKADKETSAALYTAEGLSETIKIVQRFGALNETGKLDEATLKLMASPRCGNPDVVQGKRTKRFTLGSNGWNKRHITYYLANWSSKLGEEKVARLIAKALNAWGAYGSLKFSRTSTPDADIIVSFARGMHNDMFPFDGPGYVLAHAFFPNSGSAISGDIHFDDDEEWVESNPQEELESGTDFYSVALHELGHSLGLGHSNDDRAVMFPYYRGDDGGSLQLGQDDIFAMYQLYIARPIQETTQSTTTESTTRRTRPYNTRPPNEPPKTRAPEYTTRTTRKEYSTRTYTENGHSHTSASTEPTIYTRAPTRRYTTESTTKKTRPYSTRIPNEEPRTRAPEFPKRTTQREHSTRVYTENVHTHTSTTTDSTIYTRAPIQRNTDADRVRTSSPPTWSRSTEIPTRESTLSTVTTNTPSTFYPTTNGYTRTTWYTDWTDHRVRTTTFKSNNRFPTTIATELSTRRDRPYTSSTINRIPSYPSSRNPIHSQNSISPPEPDICQGKFDAVANLRGEIFIFKDMFIWRLHDRRRIVEGYPVFLKQMFPYLPDTVKKIDAAYQRPDGNMVLFTGDFYWVYDGTIFIENSPKYLIDYGIPLEIGGIDAVQTWGRNGKTYLFKGDRFWRYDEKTRTVDPGYPVLIEKWRGIPENLDAAMTWKDGVTYFFKNDLYWTLDNKKVKATDDSPRSATKDWLGCP